MIIIPTRTMRLDGRDVFEGERVEVSDSEAHTALVRGWAIEAPKQQEPQPKRRSIGKPEAVHVQ